MSLECFKDIDTLLARKIHKYDHSRFDPQMILKKHIMVDVEKGIIQFKIQDGPRNEHGDNGCDVDEIVCACRDIVRSFNQKYPCTENERALVDLSSVLDHLDARREDRKSRNVEGANKI